MTTPTIRAPIQIFHGHSCTCYRERALRPQGHEAHCELRQAFESEHEDMEWAEARADERERDRERSRE